MDDTDRFCDSFVDTILSRLLGGTMETLSKNLFALRKKRGLSREAVARALDISFMTYQRYEKNLRDPTAPLLVKLADFFGVTLDQLVGREPLPEADDEGA
nr:helix-turn-helix transcriptional regulator [uncultured Oscillibacter sp.]